LELVDLRAEQRFQFQQIQVIVDLIHGSFPIVPLLQKAEERVLLTHGAKVRGHYVGDEAEVPAAEVASVKTDQLTPEDQVIKQLLQEQIHHMDLPVVLLQVQIIIQVQVVEVQDKWAPRSLLPGLQEKAETEQMLSLLG
jgi:hypothetical protein